MKRTGGVDQCAAARQAFGAVAEDLVLQLRQIRRKQVFLGTDLGLSRENAQSAARHVAEDAVSQGQRHAGGGVALAGEDIGHAQPPGARAHELDFVVEQIAGIDLTAVLHVLRRGKRLAAGRRADVVQHRVGLWRQTRHTELRGQVLHMEPALFVGGKPLDRAGMRETERIFERGHVLTDNALLLERLFERRFVGFERIDADIQLRSAAERLQQLLGVCLTVGSKPQLHQALRHSVAYTIIRKDVFFVGQRVGRLRARDRAQDAVDKAG